MSVKQKAMSTQLKEAVARAENAEEDLADYKRYLESTRAERDRYQLEIDSIHTALDAMFVPRSVSSGYSTKDMTIASRLFAWQAGARIENVKREVE